MKGQPKNKEQDYKIYMGQIKEFLQDGMKRKVDLQNYLGMEYTEFREMLNTITKYWPIYESDCGHYIGWLI